MMLIIIRKTLTGIPRISSLEIKEKNKEER
jgi:hypothetical protein